MARIIDQKKIQRLKHSTMKMVVKHGYGGASVALISKDAAVASGYFYMHYPGKYEMVTSIFHEVYLEIVNKFNVLVQKQLSFDENIKHIVEHFVEIANSDPVKIKFLIILTNDYSFVIDEEIRADTFRNIHQLAEMGKKSGKLDPALTDDDLYLILLTTVYQYIKQKLRKKDTIINRKDTEHLLYLIYKLLK